VLFLLTAAPAVLGLVRSAHAQAPQSSVEATPRYPTAGMFVHNAVLSSDLVSTGSPVTYTVDFGAAFGSISEIEYYFVFGDDPLDFGECLFFDGGFQDRLTSAIGFCNGETSSQTGRAMTLDCLNRPSGCTAFRDGTDSGGIWAEKQAADYVSVRVVSLTVILHGAILAPEKPPAGGRGHFSPGGQDWWPPAVLLVAGLLMAGAATLALCDSPQAPGTPGGGWGR